jgi:signal transduction histidine kinase
MPKTHIKVLLIEDNPGDVRLIWEILSEVRNSPFYLNVADSLLNGLNAIDKDHPDVILLDLSLGDSNGIYTLNRVRDRVPEVPIVILTGMDDEVTAIKSLKEGAQDYLVKGRTDSDLLKRALIYAIERNRLIYELEEKREKLEEQDKVKYNFILMVFHELLIPATSIKSAISLMEKEHTLGADSAYAEAVKNNTQRLFALLDDLIDVSEIEAGSFTVKKQDCDIKELVKRNISDIITFTDEKKVVIKQDMPDGPVRVKADIYRLSQAVTNLLINSVKFSNEMTEITVSAAVLDSIGDNAPPYVLHSFPRDKKCVVLSVKDSGAGITQQAKEEVFDAFFASSNVVPASHEGIGLGLLITKNIVSAHGGMIWAESDGENKGSSFHIILPAD